MFDDQSIRDVVFLDVASSAGIASSPLRCGFSWCLSSSPDLDELKAAFAADDAAGASQGPGKRTTSWLKSVGNKVVARLQALGLRLLKETGNRAILQYLGLS